MKGPCLPKATHTPNPRRNARFSAARFAERGGNGWGNGAGCTGIAPDQIGGVL